MQRGIIALATVSDLLRKHDSGYSFPCHHFTFPSNCQEALGIQDRQPNSWAVLFRFLREKHVRLMEMLDEIWNEKTDKREEKSNRSKEQSSDKSEDFLTVA